MKVFYGLPLRDDIGNPTTGFSELDYFAITQGSAEYDELGFVTKVHPIPYQPREYSQLWANVGRRSGKTTGLQSFIMTYEALLGGHEERVSRNQNCHIYLIAHRLDLAIESLSHIRAVVQSSPILQAEVVDDLAQKLSFKNGVVILPSPPSLKAQRGIAVPAAALDEVGFWYSDAESANPDFEVERAIRYSQAQFDPFAKRIGISTPWTKEGLLWKYTQAGTGGNKLPPGADRTPYEDILTAFGTTASWENPLISRATLARLQKEDPEAFERESLCKFLDSISGFFNYQLLQAAAEQQIADKVGERAPVRAQTDRQTTAILPNYVAAIDPAFRSDSFGFCIGHKDPAKGIVVDVVRRFTPLRGEKLDPVVILATIAPICQAYGIQIVYTDQYQFESLQQLAMSVDLYLEAVDFTAKSKAKIFGNLQQLVNQRKLQLLDPYTNDDARVMLEELQTIERRLTGMGSVQIAAPANKHDDMACVLALMAFKSMWMEPDVKLPVGELENEFREKSPFELCMATITNKQRLANNY